MTPYRRSKPVAIASEVNDDDSTASASTRGTASSIGAPVTERQPVAEASAAEQQEQAERDHQRQQQLLAVADQQPELHPRVREHLPRPRGGASTPALRAR